MIATRSSKMLKLGAVAFTVLWTLWILSWSGSFDRVNVILPSACGAIVGYAWYRAMRWQFRRKDLSGRDHDSAHRPLIAGMATLYASHRPPRGPLSCLVDVASPVLFLCLFFLSLRLSFFFLCSSS
jgi:hypothetical protein